MITIGEQIQQARVGKNLSLEEISNRLRINVAYLKDIEQSKFDFLPRPYVIAFTKIFANFVGLSGDEVVAPLREQFGAPTTALPVSVHTVPESQWLEPPPLPPRATILRERQRPGMRRIPYIREMAISLGIILAIALLLYLVSRSGESGSDDMSLETPAAPPVSSSATTSEVTLDQMEEQARQYAKPDTTLESKILTLEARINAQVWARLIIDGKDTLEATMPAGSIQTWQAQENFKLRVGNVSALTLTLNGKRLESLGPGSGPANVTITREGVIPERARTSSRARRGSTDTTRRL
ncbi:MAG: helix-turn-helix domain-containing protein [bacterium]